MFAKYRIKSVVKLSAKSLWMHRLRSVLTMLGIIFGVCSVVAMLAVGEGASRESQEQIAQLGSQNILLKTVAPPQDQNASGKTNSMKEYGLTYADVERIRGTVPDIQVVVPMRRLNHEARCDKRKTGIEVIGTVPSYIRTTALKVQEGRFFTDLDLEQQKEVCVVDEELAQALFASDNPIGRDIKIAHDYYRVIGLIGGEDPARKDKLPGETAAAVNNQPSRGRKGTVYVPLSVVKTRFGEMTFQFSTSGRQLEKVELQEIIVKVNSIDDVLTTRDILEGQLGQFHSQHDYQITVPLELLRQAMRTKRIFSIVLGSIAAISLLVGGIGIMNIMLATVSERTREIGIRRALGARRRDIIVQFLSETAMLSMVGGIVGILLGTLFPFLITYFFKMPTIVTGLSLMLAFGISGLVGISFGLYPAWRAAHMDPIESLRHE